MAKPFVKWAGGKRQIIDEINKRLPEDLENKITKYVEPFVGGGAVLFELLNNYNFEDIYISDSNENLINLYIGIRDYRYEIITILRDLEDKYLPLENEERKFIYYSIRDRYNQLENNGNNKILKSAYFIFLNKTCFNGLYRVNKKGEFNVPMGSYKKPLICDEENLNDVSNKLQGVNIFYGDFEKCYEFIEENTFVYVDPPYRPLSSTSSFTSYTNQGFNDDEQIRLSKFLKNINNKKNAKFLLSNSDPKNSDLDDNFFDDLYKEFNIDRIDANRNISSKNKSRKKIKELLIYNY